MPTFDRAAAKAAGYKDSEIDSLIAAGPPEVNPADARMQQGGHPLAGVTGVASGVMDAIGGPRTLLYGAGGLAGAAGLKHLAGLRKPAGAPVPASAPPPSPSQAMSQPGRAKMPAGLVELSEADIQRFPQLKNYQPGETIRRAALEAIKLGPEPGATAADPKGNPAEKRVAAPAKARKSRPMQGASSPALGRRIAARSAATGKSPPAMGDMDLEAQLRQSVELEQTGKQLGLSPQERSTVRSQGRTAGVFRGPRLGSAAKFAGGGANILLALLGAAETPEQMAEAEAIYLQSRLEQAPPSLQRALTDEEIY